MTTFPTILVPQGAEYQAIDRGLQAVPHAAPVAIPVGPVAVTAYMQEWLQTRPLDTPVVVMGLCGSLRSNLTVGMPVLYRACIEDSPAEQLDCSAFLTAELAEHLPSVSRVTALTCDRIIHRATDKQALAQTYRADVVDMEGFAILAALQQHSIPVAMLRVVSDDCHHDLPDLSAAISPDGQLQPLPTALGMIRQPQAAIRLIRGSLKGLQVLEQLTRTLVKAAIVTEP